MKKLLACIAVIFVSLTSFIYDEADDILGVWASGSNKGHIQIYQHDGKYYGKIIWLKQPYDQEGKPKMDKNNPDAKARKKSLIGLVMLRDFTYNDGEWVDGKVYNPDNGKEYKCNMKLSDSKTLAVRGYLGFSLIGKTKKFKRVN